LIHAEISLAGLTNVDRGEEIDVAPILTGAMACYHFRRGGAREIYNV
jgi:hypothetical protein